MKLKPETVKKLEEAFSIGADVSAACYYADISRQSYYNWIKENKELGQKLDRLREKPVLQAYQTVVKNLNDKETAKWYLERKRKKEFSTRIENESNVTVTGIIQIPKREINEQPREQSNSLATTEEAGGSTD